MTRGPGVNEDLHLAVFISFLFRPSRLTYLFRTVNAVCGLGVGSVDVSIVTDAQYRESIDGLFFLFQSTRITIKAVAWPDVDRDKRKLPLFHKRMLLEKRRSTAQIHTHFLYLEDDIIFTSENFRYYLEHRRGLQEFGLVPGFLRVEVGRRMRVVATDLTFRPRSDTSVAHVGGFSFRCLEECYCAMYLLDRDLADEYVVSESFSDSWMGNGLNLGFQERAAMGIALENIPAGFSRRVAIPFDSRTRIPDRACWVHHATENYADDERSPFAKIEVSGIFSD